MPVSVQSGTFTSDSVSVEMDSSSSPAHNIQVYLTKHHKNQRLGCLPLNLLCYKDLSSTFPNSNVALQIVY
ncbi:hypothetical protein RIF29_20756 [Crotalaria pallida]|uniref:Uncharacterized protein n=1 Tax=Crotalaria pallida TaxID=3830 RepID=A0AAN9F438_CROPI